MRGRTKMLLAQEAERRRGRGNDYGNPYDNEKPNNRYESGNGGEMRDRPYYAYDSKPVNIYIPPMSPSNNDYRGNGMEYRGEYGQYPPPMYESRQLDERRIGFDGGYGGQMHGGGRTETNSRNLYFSGSANRGTSSKEIDKEQAEEWTEQMINSDGTKGAHWTMNDAKALKEKLNLNSIDPIEFYVTLNMMYSDYCSTAKQFGVDRPEFYAHLAKAFLMDKDAGPDKLHKYFSEVVGK